MFFTGIWSVIRCTTAVFKISSQLIAGRNKLITAFYGTPADVPAESDSMSHVSFTDLLHRVTGCIHKQLVSELCHYPRNLLEQAFDRYGHGEWSVGLEQS